ncbi:MAG: di/tricarboxylate transporter, partial [Lentimonas sp.]
TPTNIIIASYRQEISGEMFTMFDFAPVGGVVALCGIIFMVLIGWRFVKVRKTDAGSSLFEIESYLFETKISKKSELAGKIIRELEEIIIRYDVTLAALVHKEEYNAVPSKKYILSAGDMLILEGTQENIGKIVTKYSLSLLAADNVRKAISHSEDTVMMEVVLAPGSNIENKLVEQVRFKSNHTVNLLAVSREGKSLRARLHKLRLKVGDVLLLHGEQENIEKSLSKLNCFPLARRNVVFRKRRHSRLALGIFITAIAFSALSILPIQVSLGLAVVAMVLTNIIPVRELYDGVDWPVVFLLGALIPVGGALETTGTTQILADSLLGISNNIGIVGILIIVMIVTMTLSDVLNNAATAILMAPIGKTIAESAGVSADPFLMAIAIGSSCAFLTPIGHQNNALVMGPGGYRFGDYWRIGLPLEIIIVVVSIPMILWIWPL